MAAQPGDEGAGRAEVIRFGVFELDPSTGELRKRGVKLKLQGKPLQVLQALLERPGEVVTREELRRRLWPADVFVDVESGLNTAANRLRLTLGDSADSPRYIETLARVGYRFIAPVRHGGPQVVEDRAADAPGAEASLDPIDRRRPLRDLVAWSVLLVLVAVATVLALRRPGDADFEFRPVTFGRGQVWGARFAPDGRTILYSANWDDGRRQLYLTSPVSPESRPLGFPDLRLVAVSRTGDLALLASGGTANITGGELARVPMNGGAPLPIEKNVMAADWAPDGRLALVRAIDGINQLEFPSGSVRHQTSGWLSSVRVAPDGRRVAFVEHPVRHDNRGVLKLVDDDGVRALSDEWANAGGVAWYPGRDEIWFTASRDATPRSVWAADLSGGLRPVIRIAGALTLRDIASDGTLLATRDSERLEMAVVREAGAEPRNLSWLDWSRIVDVSRDGRVVLFDESGVGGGPQYQIYLRRLDDDSTVRLGDGLALGLSPDGRFAVALGPADRTRLRLLPLDAGQPVELPPTGLHYQWARYLPDGERLLTLANEPGQPLRLYVHPAGGGTPIAITPPAVVRNAAVSPDGSQVALLSAAGTLLIYPTAAPGEGRLVPAAEPLAPLLWAEPDWIHVQHLGAATEIPTRLSRLHLPTGRLEPWRDLAPRDAAGVNAITKVVIAADARTVIFNYRRVLSELFVARPASR